MMFFLMSNVVQHPWQLLLAKAHYAETALPLKPFHARLLVDLMGTGALQIANEFADAYLRLNLDSHMNVRWCAADSMHSYAAELSAAIREKRVDCGLDRCCNQRLTVLGVPVHVQVDLMEGVARHG